MNKRFLSNFLSLLFVSVTVSLSAQSPEDAWEGYVAELKAQYNDNETTPLDSLDKTHFKGINFYSYNPAARVQAKVKRLKNQETVGFPTSTDRIAQYRPYAILKFKIKGKKMELVVYESATPIKGYEDYLFLPFSDLTSGVETYGAGRYKDMTTDDLEGKKKVTIDFNSTYHPYCAYSHKYSCPVSPDCNALPIKLEAGVRL